MRAAQVAARPREIAISPVRTISIRPNGRTIRSNASILSSVPVISTVTARFDTSITLPRKMSVNCMIWPRDSLSAETLNSASSRATASPGSRSRILITLTSLCSCFVTWSIGWSAPSTVRVIRDSVGSSVGPTASVWMLKPRREKRPAIRASTPGLFSTSREMMCLRPVWIPPAASRSARFRMSLVPGSPTVLPHHVARGLAGGDHRVAVLFLRHPDVEHDGPLGGDGLAHRLDQRGLVGGEHAVRAIGLGELHPVGVRPHVDRRVAAIPEELLPLPDHAQVAVVHDEDLDR